MPYDEVLVMSLVPELWHVYSPVRQHSHAVVLSNGVSVSEVFQSLEQESTAIVIDMVLATARTLSRFVLAEFADPFLS